VTLGEGDTPLVLLPRWGPAHGLDRVYAKLEFTNPTGSYKDRGMAVLVTLAVEAGAVHLVEDSSGNAGAAAAAYAARAGLTCTVYAPAAAPAAKLRQIRAYGAELIEVPGPRSSVADAARQAGNTPGAYHVSHNDNPAFVPGNKTFAYEIGEAWRAGAFGSAGGHAWHLVIPTGGGALFCGAWQGFLEEAAVSGQSAGAEADAPTVMPGLPRMHAAQTVACAPLARAFEQGSAEPVKIDRVPSACGGIEIERPARGHKILAAIRASGGTAVASEEEEILTERDRLAELEGIYAEPTSAAACAGLIRLARQGAIGRQDVVILAITGSGLKDPGPTAVRK
jgi:threonine synthase